MRTIMTAWAVIVAGGAGKRMGTDTPKQFLTLCGKTILERTIEPFAACSEIDGIVIAAPESGLVRTESIISDIPYLRSRFRIVAGGENRRDSVRNALAAVPEDTEIVVIHDAVRPFIRSSLISSCIQKARDCGAVSVMRPLKETVKVVSDGIVMKTPDRSSLRITQTPQAFRKDLIMKAHKQALEDGFIGTDDCMLVERLGKEVHIIEGDDYNIKITTPADLTIAEALYKLFENRGKQC